MNNLSKIFHYRSFLVKIVIFSILLYGGHYFIIEYYFADSPMYITLWKIYAFHIITVCLIIYMLWDRSKKKTTQIFYTFILLSTLKMVAAIVFLLPLFLNKIEKPEATVFSFFIPFFLFLIFELYYAVTILVAKK